MRKNTSILLEANANVDAKDGFGETPLSHTIGIGLSASWTSPGFNQATNQLLLEAGATVEQCHWDATPHWFQEQNARYAPIPPPSARLDNDIARVEDPVADEEPFCARMEGDESLREMDE